MKDYVLRQWLKYSIGLPGSKGMFIPPNPFYGKDNVDLREYRDVLVEEQKKNTVLELFPIQIEKTYKRLRLKQKLYQWLLGLK